MYKFKINDIVNVKIKLLNYNNIATIKKLNKYTVDIEIINLKTKKFNILTIDKNNLEIRL